MDELSDTKIVLHHRLEFVFGGPKTVCRHFGKSVAKLKLRTEPFEDQLRF